MKNLVWTSWLINNPIVMWTSLGVMILVPIIAVMAISIANKIKHKRK